MASVDDLITEIQQSFDVTPTDALAVLNRRHQSICNTARWHRETRAIVTDDGSIVGAVSAALLPSDIVELFYVETVTSGGDILYSRTINADIPAINAGTLVLSGRGGVFYEQPPSNALSESTTLLLYPAVAVGTTVLLVGAFNPIDLALGDSGGGSIRVPREFRGFLLAGVYSDLLSRPNEARPDLAAQQEALFQQGAAQLRDRADRRYRTKGPRQIRIAV